MTDVGGRRSEVGGRRSGGLKLKTVSAIIILISVSIANAKVFTRWKGGSDLTGTLTRLGGTPAYNADIKINGGAAKLAVIGFTDTIGSMTSDICRILNIPADKTPPARGLTPSTSIYILKGPQKTRRLILLNLPRKQKLLAITIEQSNSDYEKSTAPPARHQLKAIPAYPGSTPEFYAENSDTKLELELSATTAAAEAVKGFYHQALQSDGWHPFLSDSAGSIPLMTIYQRDMEIACVLATQTRNSTKILMLHKTLTR